MAISDNLRGVAYMCLSMLAFTVNDTFMKSVTAEVPLFQVIFLRGLVAIAGLAVMGFVTGAFRQKLAGGDWGLIALRSLAEILATLTFLTALLHMELANLSAIMQALPLAVTLAAAVVFKDRIGWRRMLAILVGFAGVLLIIRPGTAAFDVWSLMGVASVLSVVVRDLSVRRLGANVPSIVVALGAAVLVALMVLPFAVFWLARIVTRAVGWVLAWLWAAGMEGWTAAGPKAPTSAGGTLPPSSIWPWPRAWRSRPRWRCCRWTRRRSNWTSSRPGRSPAPARSSKPRSSAASRC